MNQNRPGDWMELSTGIQFYPLDPRPEEITLQDIAHALGMLCRFNGHCKQFYSVAQHSLNCYYVAKRNQHSLRIQFFALMHDAPEAYLADIVRPLKPFIAGYKEIEACMEAAIWKTFGFIPTDEEMSVVKGIDDAVLRAEGFLLMNNLNNWTRGDKPDINITVMFPSEAKFRFENKVKELLEELSM